MTQNNVGIYASQISGHLWAPNGAYDALATITIGASAVSAIEFAGIPQGYRDIELRGVVMTNSATNPTWKVNNDSTTANYSGHHLWGTGAAASLNNQSGTVYWNYNPSSSYPSAFIMHWKDYASNTKNKTMRTIAGSETNGGTSEIAMWSGGYYSTNPITSIQLNGNGAMFAQYTTISLYGIK